MTFSPEQIGWLQAKLDAGHVKPPKQYGPKGDYLEGWHVIAEANRIFGFDGWSYETVDTKCVAEAGRKIGQSQKDGWGVTYTSRVRVTINGIVREDFGAGHGYDADLGLAHESAIKEAVTDALKRALRTFGNVFGLALYDKSRANVGPADDAATDKTDKPTDPSKPVSAAEMKRGLEAITQELLDCRTPNDAQKIWKAWTDVFKAQKWSQDYIDIAKERVQERGRKLKEALEVDEIFPGDIPSRVNQHLSNSPQRPL